MNILYLHTHDMGRYNQMYGYQIKTPEMFQVAQKGVLFRNAFCAAPTCSPSRAALLTGQSPHRAGILGLAHRGFGIADPREHLSWYLREHGYQTALFGMQHEINDPALLGYDQFDIPKTKNTEEYDTYTADAAVSCLNQYGGGKPFFLSVGFTYPHRHFRQELDGVDPDYVMPPACLPDTPETREDYAHYVSSVQYVDKKIGQVLAALRNSGQEEQTIILLTTDHGIAFPFMKCNLYDTGIAVSLALQIPGYPGGKVCNALVSQVDIYPTLCELIGADIPPHVTGRSLVSILKGEQAEVNNCIFAEVTNHAAYEPMRCIRTNQYKYIRRFDCFAKPVCPNIDSGLTKELLLAHGLEQMPLPQAELYDLLLDPNERHNLVSSPQYQVIAEELRQKLLQWMEQTEDPLLSGERIVPADARVNPQTGKEPNETDWEN